MLSQVCHKILSRGRVWRGDYCESCALACARCHFWRKLCSRVCAVPFLGFFLCRPPCAGQNRVLEGYFLRGGNVTSGCVYGPFSGWAGLCPFLLGGAFSFVLSALPSRRGAFGGRYDESCVLVCARFNLLLALGGRYCGSCALVFAHFWSPSLVARRVLPKIRFWRAIFCVVET